MRNSLLGRFILAFMLVALITTGLLAISIRLTSVNRLSNLIVDQQRSTLQRVSYAMVDDVLKRSYQTSLDTVSGNKPVVQDLFTRVKAIQLRYLDANQSWQSSWPAPALPPDQGLWTRPVAVEIIIEFKDWGRVRRLVEVAG